MGDNTKNSVTASSSFNVRSADAWQRAVSDVARGEAAVNGRFTYCGVSGSSSARVFCDTADPERPEYHIHESALAAVDRSQVAEAVDRLLIGMMRSRVLGRIEAATAAGAPTDHLVALLGDGVVELSPPPEPVEVAGLLEQIKGQQEPG